MAKEKYIPNPEIYETLKPFDEISLDCYGFVAGIRGLEKKQGKTGVEAVLLLQNGKELRRLFNNDLTDLFVKAGVFYTDASFRFIITKYQSKLSSHIINEKPPKNYPGVVEMPKFDFSVLEKFTEREAGL